MKKNKFSAIVLAGGIGKRMMSKKSKVLHQIAGKPMIQRTVETLEKLSPEEIIVVANNNNYRQLKKILPHTHIVIQHNQAGTADAAGIGLKFAGNDIQTVAVLYGDDTAFYKSATIHEVFSSHIENNSKITFVTVKKENPYGLGRIVRKNGKLISIIEEKDATTQQRKINEVNDGLYFFDKEYLAGLISRLSPSRITGELYITDTISQALKEGQKVQTFLLEDSEQWHGINTQIELAKANLKLNKNIHIMGICGAGASAVAGIAKARGYIVSGCDANPNGQYVGGFKELIKKGHDKKHIKNLACLITSPAVIKLNPQNEEVKEAQKIGLPVLTWQEFQGAVLMENKFNICIAGAYGKSTTTALIGEIFTDAQLDPTVEVGAKVLRWKNNFKVGASKYYICEADEYNDNFLNFHSDIAVILNVHWDHPDFFHDEVSLVNSFSKFINNIKYNGQLITTNQVLTKINHEIRKDIKIALIYDFKVAEYTIIGNFRKENINAALTVAKSLNLNIEKAKISVKSFRGLARRLEYKGRIGIADFYDDYAVQPYTIQKTAQALINYKNQGKFLLIIEPHTFSRVKKFFNNFVKHIKNIKVDQIFITDVYSARENGTDKSTISKDLASSIGKNAKYTGSVQKTAKAIRKVVSSYNLVLTMGAGDVYKIFDILKND